ncbi:MAG TPA: right-handed parallel beta-helix repeat-containing protein [Luteolibacter sp.]
MKPHLILMSAALGACAHAAEFHVSPGGSDSNPGTLKKPFASLEKARDAARTASGGSDVILLHGGAYQLEKTLELTPADNGLVIQAADKEAPVLSGGRAINGWRKLTEEPAGVSAAAQGKLWTADVPKSWCFHYLYVNGKSMPRARLHNTRWRQWPTDFTRGKPTANGQDVTFKNKAILNHIPSNGDVEMVCIMAQYGVMGNGVMTQVNPESGTAVWNSTQTHLGFRTRDANRYTLENAIPFIDQPGEWCVDSTAGKVYFWPESDDMASAKVIAPKLYELIRLQGDEAAGKIVENVSINGLTMVHTDRLPEDKWPASWIRRQWEHPDAMVYLQGVRNCVISNNRLLHSGASGITLDQFCQGNRVEGNEIGWPGSNGVFLIGYGPGTLDVNKNNIISRNWIHDMGQANYWHSGAIQIFQSGHNQISLNLLQRSAYTCISIVGIACDNFNNPDTFFRDNSVDVDRQFKEWSMFGIRSQDFPKEIQDGVRAKTYKFNRETVKPYLHSRDNLIENNIVLEPEQLLDEGGAIYAYWCGKGNIWKDNLVFKSSGMPGSSVLSLDNVAEFTTITGNVVWVNGRAACGTIGVRPTERGNVIKGNIRAAFRPEHADGPANVNGLKSGFYTTDATRDPVYQLLEVIIGKAKAAGGLRGNPATALPGPNEEIKDAVQRVLPKGSHLTIE